MRLALMYLGRGEGTDHFILSHARVMSKQVELTCYLSGLNTLLDEFNKLPCRVRTFDWSRGFKRLVLAQLLRRDVTGVSQSLLSDNPDVILDTHANEWSSVVETGLRGRIPVAEVIHDTSFHPGPMAILGSIHRKLVPSQADAVIGLSYYTYKQLVQMFPGKVHIKSKHGIFLPDAEVDHDAVAARNNRFLFLGKISRYKGIEVLVDAYAILKESNPDINVEIVGSGPIEPSVLAKISELGIGLTNRYVTDGELKDAIGANGVIVLPYTSATQSGVAAIALGNGMPGIASNVGALPEQIVNGRNGIVVPAGDADALASAMIKIARDRPMARRMSEEAVRIGCEDYSWDKISVGLLQDLEDLVARADHRMSV